MKIVSWLSPIHDVTTDTENPPAFVDILPLRRNAANPAEYGGPQTAALQRKTYPDIRPLRLELSRPEAFTRAAAAARGMKWKIVAEEEESGRIEATATTFWCRFKDDVVIRIASEGSGSRVDVRSVSRIGSGDLGTNARRIRRFLKLVQAAD